MSDPDLEIVAKKVAEMIWPRIQNLHAKVSSLASTPMSNTPSKNYFFLFLGFEAPGPSTVFYYVNDEWMAKELYKLFESNPGESRELKISYLMIDGNDISQLVLLQESVDELSIYTDPDLGVYDPKPSECLIRMAQYYSRAKNWEIALGSIRKQKLTANEIQGSSVQADSMLTDSEIQAFETVRNLLEKHRLIFLYFAVPRQFDPSVTGNSWQTVTLAPEIFRKFEVEEIDDNGDFLFTYRRRLEQFAQACFRRFGSGQGNKPRVPLEDDTIVEVEGGTLPFWRLDEVACVHLEESAEQILFALRDATRKKCGQMLQGFIPAIKSSLHDANKPKWYASDSVRWEYLSQIDAILHELRTFEPSDFDSSGAASSQEPTKYPENKASLTSEQTLDDLLKGLSEEDCRNASNILLMLFAQAYFKMLEETTSISEWLTQMDMELNHSYIWIVQNLTNLLKNCPHLRDFPTTFEPIFEDLYPGTIEDIEWKLMVAPHAENFLSVVQKYTLKKGFYAPEEGSPAWIMVQLFRPGVDEAIERASNYNLRLRKLKQQVLQKNSPVPKPNTSDVDSQSKESTKSDDTVQNALKFGFAELDKCTWSDVAILFINSETVFVKIKEHSKRLVFSDFGMEQKNTRRPTVQWHLLYDFAREHGTLDWTSRRASQDNRKRREKLSAQLKDFFGIPGEPINKTADGKGWVTIFKCDEY